MIWKRLKKLTPEQEQEYRERLQDVKLDWKDRVAMLLAAFLTIFLPCVLVLGALALVMMWMFGLL